MTSFGVKFSNQEIKDFLEEEGLSYVEFSEQELYQKKLIEIKQGIEVLILLILLLILIVLVLIVILILII